MPAIATIAQAAGSNTWLGLGLGLGLGLRLGLGLGLGLGLRTGSGFGFGFGFYRRVEVGSKTMFTPASTAVMHSRCWSARMP